MKIVELEELSYKDLQNNLIKGVYFERLVLGKELLNIRNSSKYLEVLNFREPEFDDNQGDFFIMKFDNEEEMKNSVPDLLNNRKYISDDYNCIRLCNANSKLTLDQFEEAKEYEATEELFNYDDVYLEHTEDFKEEIFKKYFEKDIDYILKDMRECIEYNDLEDFNERKKEFESIVKQLDNVNFCNRYGNVDENIDFSEYIEKDDSIKEIKEILDLEELKIEKQEILIEAEEMEM